MPGFYLDETKGRLCKECLRGGYCPMYGEEQVTLCDKGFFCSSNRLELP